MTTISETRADCEAYQNDACCVKKSLGSGGTWDIDEQDRISFGWTAEASSIGAFQSLYVV